MYSLVQILMRISFKPPLIAMLNV